MGKIIYCVYYIILKGKVNKKVSEPQNIIYLDNAATTPVSKSALEAMLPFFSECYGNPSNSEIYEMGAVAKNAIEGARAKVAAAINCTPKEIFFTSGGTESINWAITGTAKALSKKGKNHLITTKIEHHAVLHTMGELKKQGFDVTYLDVDGDGFVSAESVEKAIREDTALVTCMYANNEIGTVQNIAEIGALCRKKGVWFHTDAVQAVGAVPIDVVAQNVDMLSMSGHKFNGPKGVGALYLRKGINPENLLFGGSQEAKRRAGTENVAGIVGLGTALEISVNSLNEKRKKLSEMRDYVINYVQKNIPSVILNGPKDLDRRLTSNVNFSFPAAESESILLFLNMKGICASSGSACTSGELDPSHVLLAIGQTHADANCSVRISFGVQNTMQEAKILCEELEKTVAEVRRRSPIWPMG